MTNEELDIARAEEAWRIMGGTLHDPAAYAARLAREGWTPPEPVDPLLLIWRETMAEQYPNAADQYLKGECDDQQSFGFFGEPLWTALQRGHELGRVAGITEASRWLHDDGNHGAATEVLLLLGKDEA